jgi:predicted Zn-dependent protease
MRKIIYISTLALGLAACTRVPITNRSQLNMLPESEMISLSLSEYSNFLAKNPTLPSSNPNEQMVERIGARISSAVESYFRQRNMANRLEGYKWEFHLVENKQANAWCMPGGKVVVYSGLLPFTQDETGLAFVMGHEISHAVARHGNERMSEGLIAQAGGLALNVALSQKSEQTRNIFLTAYGVGANYGVMLPYSRIHESEADKLGLVFMSIAGYNPNEAATFFERMAKGSGPKPPELMSTHPSDETRIRDIKAFLPEALKYYKPQ